MNKNKTILIIDDVEENIYILERRLISEGFKVHSANEGEKGLQILQKEPIDLILLDINMPVLDGITILEGIREDSSLSHVAILMVTANEDVSMALKCLKKGACGYITKPYSMEQMNQQIEHCLR